MSAELVKYAFVAGEVTPKLLGRTDLEKYDLGLAEASNWFVDFEGGLSTRSGLEFIDYVQHDDRLTKFVKFQFAPNVANTYVILFGHLYARFIQDGAYVLEGNKTVTNITQANPGVVTSAAHGYSVGDWFYLSGIVGMTELNGRLIRAGTVTANTIQLGDPFGNNLNTGGFAAYISGGVMNRVYTVVTPYEGSDLPDLKAYQRQDNVRLTHPRFLTRNLTRSAHTSWALAVEDIGNSIDTPSNLVITASATVAAGLEFSGSVGFQVTAVNRAGVESQPSGMFIEDEVVNIAAQKGSYTVTWTGVAGTAYYNVYRTNILSMNAAGEGVTRSQSVGFVGIAYAPVFTDGNIIPDFARTPPQYQNPFANAEIETVTVTAGGAGYSKNSTVSIAGAPGTGFRGVPIVSEAGVIIGVIILNGGKNYAAPVVSFSGGGGVGATATATVGLATGNHPSTSTIFQQRQLYAGSLNAPLGIEGSRPGQLSNFDVSQVLNDGDAYSYEIESQEAATIRHLMETRGGLLIMSETGIWQLHGSIQDAVVTPINAAADTHSYRGVSDVVPLRIDTEILYVEGKGFTVRLMNYNELSKVYAGQNISILSSHLFGVHKQIVAWDYAQNPHHLVCAARSDGALLLFTLVREQDVFAWTPCYTKGRVLDVAVVTENGRDAIYLMVRRLVNDRWTNFIERMTNRVIDNVEEAFCVDSGLELTRTYPDATLRPGAISGTDVEFEVSETVLGSVAVGDIVIGRGGRAVIISITDTTHFVANIERDFPAVPEDADENPVELGATKWYWGRPSATLSGLRHLEGQAVVALAAGNVIEGLTVVNGSVTLPAEAFPAVAGLKYTCQARTLPPVATEATIEARRKKILGVAVRIHDTRGLKTGATLSSLYDMKDQTTEAYGEPVQLRSGQSWQLQRGAWTKEGQTYFVQENPLPATILGLVTDMEVGDDTR